MMQKKITALEIQKKNRNRVNVYLDEEFAFGLSRINATWLEIGNSLSEGEIRELLAADAREMAYQKAIHYLSFRPRSEKEIKINLRKHKFTDEVICDIISKLKKGNLVNDLDFAQNWVENRSEFRPRGQKALKFELVKKGINNDIIEEVLLNIDDEELAYKAALKQISKYKQLEWEDLRKKMLMFLARRGFSYAIAASTVKKFRKEYEGAFSRD
jgi:regulatory protein